ncbi:hypothetical protein KFE25_009704 [Diacronema lutheri]|uniref:Uncharacterized protein n=1 Tax=Diacronema lutheri TaxID=2081491 RepID=A0A8J5XSM7_DIALT|nr:hypothetical protein KFE25_005591 [Diacronema lutheri]KAG8470953.1 hypothetical protein KFE25_009374 [Diacronema lutheri]KAG8471283.1 hypothetical protein KFE25_009704 [Diacronema lutheri]
MGLSGSVAIVLYVRARRREVQHGRVATPRIIQRQLELQLPWGRPDEASVASRAETPGVEAASRSVRDAAPEPDPDEGYSSAGAAHRLRGGRCVRAGGFVTAREATPRAAGAFARCIVCLPVRRALL